MIASMIYHDNQIMERECNIRDMLSEIAVMEMTRSIVDEELEEVTLRTIEMINISDIHIERENLQCEMGYL